MNIKYRVLSTDEQETSFVIRYFTDLITEEELNVEYDIDGDIVYDSNGYPLKCRTDYNISIVNSNEVTKDNVNIRIIECAPVDWLKNLEEIKKGKIISLANVNTLVSQVRSFSEEEYRDRFSIPVSLEEDEKFKTAVTTVVNSILNNR